MWTRPARTGAERVPAKKKKRKKEKGFRPEIPSADNKMGAASSTEKEVEPHTPRRTDAERVPEILSADEKWERRSPRRNRGGATPSTGTDAERVSEEKKEGRGKNPRRMDPATSASGGQPLQITSPITDPAELRDIIVRQGAIIRSYQDQVTALQAQLSGASIAAPIEPPSACGESPPAGFARKV
ncbi:hypothetical protein QTP70_020457 [Hemibagrus guttatus]|uniref:Uncharacterized protein n=1 Tax=Hemibagrus guttatus TaxID=175788 RepID=A0AAE0QJU2_9TELE|nr:hypothetical protein QTP70_020457 [Hemibagrus guttatus]